jgi:formylglycine-generating enzyme required for sulfatase activity
MRNLMSPTYAPVMVALAFLTMGTVYANNIQVSNATLSGTNVGASYTNVRFDITWENSWRTSSAPNNWDAAWVFVKYRDANTGLWQHARLGGDAEHVAPTGSTLATGLLTPGSAFNASTNWGVGAFLYRSTNGSGTFSATGVQLRWNYGQNGIALADIAEVKVFGVEMVYVNEGAFALGSGGSGNGEFYPYPNSSASYPISSEGEVPVGQTNGYLYYPSSPDSGDRGGPIPAAFPKGFKAFYLMKHEIAQQDFVDFLNTLTRTQQNARTQTDLSAGITTVTNRYVMRGGSTLEYKSGIRCDATIPANDPVTFYCDGNANGIGGEFNDGQWIACNYLNWADVSAYLDWSGLRPMTELEYEKACRGPATPVAYEYAWGITTASQATSQTNAGAINEACNAGANASCATALNMQFPVRVGCFAQAGTNRASAGAGYYGALELSGNVWEQAVTVGKTAGRAYTGTHGDGQLSTSGAADASTWPGSVVTGSGLRGGHWNISEIALQVSNRLRAAVIGARNNSEGGRGVRIAPL